MSFSTGWVQDSKILAVSRKLLSSMAISFGKRPRRVEQIKLTKLARLICSKTYRILRGVLWTVVPPVARTTISLSSSWSTWPAPGSSLALVGSTRAAPDFRLPNYSHLYLCLYSFPYAPGLHRFAHIWQNHLQEGHRRKEFQEVSLLLVEGRNASFLIAGAPM